MTKHGPLLKKMGVSSKWTRCECTLDGTRFKVDITRPNGGVASQFLDLSGGSARPSMAPGATALELELLTGPRTVRLRAATAAEYEQWLGWFRDSFSAATAGPGSPGTTFKSLSLARFPDVCTGAHFSAIRAALREYGVESLRQELSTAGFVTHDKMLSTGTKPFNIFARVAAGVQSQGPQMEAENAVLSEEHASRFVLACNRPESDKQWDSADPQWVGKASMSQRHRFLLVRDLSWRWFNALVFGVQGGAAELEEALEMLQAMREASMAYTAASALGWSKNVGLFLHVHGHNSVNALHLHIVDLDATGPTYEVMRHKNLSLADAEEVLREELRRAPPLGHEHEHERERDLERAGKKQAAASKKPRVALEAQAVRQQSYAEECTSLPVIEHAPAVLVQCEEVFMYARPPLEAERGAAEKQPELVLEQSVERCGGWSAVEEHLAEVGADDRTQRLIDAVGVREDCEERAGGRHFGAWRVVSYRHRSQVVRGCRHEYVMRIAVSAPEERSGEVETEHASLTMRCLELPSGDLQWPPSWSNFVCTGVPGCLSSTHTTASPAAAAAPAQSQ